MPQPIATTSTPNSHKAEGYHRNRSRKETKSLESATKPAATKATMVDPKSSQATAADQLTESSPPQADSQSSTKSPGRLEIEKEFQDVSKTLEELMHEHVAKEHPKIMNESLNLNLNEETLNHLKSMVERLVDDLNPAEPRGVKDKVKNFAERYFMVAFPFVKGALDQAKDYLPSHFGIGVSAFLYLMQIPYNKITYGKDIRDTIASLPDTISRLGIVTEADLHKAIRYDKLDHFCIAGLKLSTAITKCLIKCIQLTITKSKKWKSVFSSQSPLETSKNELQTAVKNYDDLFGPFNTAISAQIREHQIKIQEEQRKKEILSWLSSRNEKVRHEALRTSRVEDTGTWFLDSVEFQEWVNRSYQVLLCPGQEGAGKTFITSCVIDWLCRKFDGGTGVAYAYLDYQEKIDRAELMKSLLVQLLDQCSELPPDVKIEYERYVENKKDNLKEDRIAEMFASCTSKFKDGVFIILDAFDEARPELQLMLKQKYFQHFVKLKLQLFITGRPQPLKEIKTASFTGPRELENSAKDKDIEMYLKKELMLQYSLDERTRDVILNSLKDKAGGKFRLVEFQLKYILKIGDSREMLEALYYMPESLPAAYQKVIDRMDCGQKKRAFRAMSWIFHAPRPLLMQELCEALTIRERDEDIQTAHIPKSDSIIQDCESLVGHDEGNDIVRFTHATVYEYLKVRQTSPKSSDILPASDLAKVCLTYLQFPVFCEPCHNEEAFRDRLGKYKFSEYAARYWGYHTKGDPENDNSVRAMVINTLIQKSGRLQSICQIRLFFEVPWFRRFVRKCDGSWLHLIIKDRLSILLKDPEYRNEYLTRKCLADAISSRDKDERTPLIYAADEGLLETVRWLVVEGADISASDKDGKTALHHAARRGHPELVEWLVEKGADISASDKDGKTALHHAARRGHPELVERLVEKGADISASDECGKAALHYAAMRGSLKPVEWLVEKGADISASDKDGKTALHYAATYRNLKLVKWLVEKGADISASDEDGKTALHYAAISGSLELVEWLVEKGADISASDEDERRRCIMQLGGEV